ncbi:MAG: glutamate--tRNA ligase [Calditrichaeota bacterium]|nr:MAG: glutamate--tRNA ligase [Calditrichota bacterium]
MGKVRVRFAPSPTGYLHVGGARTAIFNWLFARKYQGKFLLRIEDTDVARSGQEMVEAIFSSLQWLGLDWDEEPIFQSKRFHIYKQYAERLVEEGKAYRCYCSPERLQQLRERSIHEGGALKYDRHCLFLSEEQRMVYEKEGRAAVIRFKVEAGATTFHDEVYGNVTWDHKQIDDFVILRSDGIPTYHLAVVVDDKEMDITHVIRGDDHLSNTPKHLLLYKAFGWEAPVFAHVPLILGPDKRRLSKRHGATSVEEYRKAGYLPEALFNFLALLGWSPGDDREILSRQELIDLFDLSSISKKSAIFNEKKLEWMNGQYIQKMDDEKLVELVVPELVKAGLIRTDEAEHRHDYLVKVIRLLKTRVKRLTEFAPMAIYFFRDPDQYDAQGVEKHWKESRVIEWFNTLIGRLAELKDFSQAHIEQVIRGLAEELEISAAKLIHPTRLALTGLTATPGLFEVMEILGQETVLRRLRKAVEFLKYRFGILE